MSSATSIVTDQVSEREKWQADLNLRERELALKEEEQKLKQVELRRSQWANPLVLAVLAATLAAVGNAFVAYINGNAQRELESTRSEIQQTIEQSKAEYARILEVIKTDNPDKAIGNLVFLLDTGLIRDSKLRNDIKNYVENVKPGQGPSLPAQRLADIMRGQVEIKPGIDAKDLEEAIKSFGWRDKSAQPFTR